MVEEEGAVFLLAQEGGGAGGADGALEGVSDGAGFSFFGRDADHFSGRAQGRNREGEGVGRN